MTVNPTESHWAKTTMNQFEHTTNPWLCETKLFLNSWLHTSEQFRYNARGEALVSFIDCQGCKESSLRRPAGGVASVRPGELQQCRLGRRRIAQLSATGANPGVERAHRGRDIVPATGHYVRPSSGRYASPGSVLSLSRADNAALQLRDSGVCVCVRASAARKAHTHTHREAPRLRVPKA